MPSTRGPDQVGRKMGQEYRLDSDRKELIRNKKGSNELRLQYPLRHIITPTFHTAAHVSLDSGRPCSYAGEVGQMLAKLPVVQPGCT
jgi:hypothetical protein